MSRSTRIAELRRRTYEILELGTFGDWVSVTVSRLILALIVINLVSITLESVPDLAARYGALFGAIEMISIAVFTAEYLLRLWAAVEHAPYSHLAGQRARIRYALSPAGIVDLLAVLPFWIALLFPVDVRILLVFRTVRFLKLARYSPAMRSLLNVLARERRALFGCFVILIGVALVAASIMYHVEREAQPDKLGTIPDAIWWAVVTLGTVGYGDVVPITPLGRVVATFTIFSGIIVLALPIGIIANRVCGGDPPEGLRRVLEHDRARAAVHGAHRRGDRRDHAAAACADRGCRRGDRAPWRSGQLHVLRCGR
jgi:voltage-gated potassium channel